MKNKGSENRRAEPNFYRSIFLRLLSVFTILIFSPRNTHANPAPFLSFHDAVLYSGTDGLVGAVYKFANVSANIDAWVEIVSLEGGASLSDIDHFTAGYFKAWQPFVTAAPNDTSGINWKITFKKAGTTTDTVLSKVVVTAIDVDGDGVTLREFVEAVLPSTYAVGANCNLTISVNNGNLNAISPVTNQANIDTLVVLAMFQMKFMNISTILYRTGAISTKSTTDVRQSSLYFKAFFSDEIVLPISLTSFNAVASDATAKLNWETESELNCSDFTIERSTNGIEYTSLAKIKAAGTSPTKNSYSFTDNEPEPGNNYYRLLISDFDGSTTYSPVRLVNFKNKNSTDSNLMIVVSPNPFNSNLRVNCLYDKDCKIKCEIINSSGILIATEQRLTEKGNNQFYFDDLEDIPRGSYFVVITTDNNSKSFKIIKR